MHRNYFKLAFLSKLSTLEYKKARAFSDSSSSGVSGAEQRYYALRYRSY